MCPAESTSLENTTSTNLPKPHCHSIDLHVHNCLRVWSNYNDVGSRRDYLGRTAIKGQ